MADSLYAAGFRPFNPVYTAPRQPDQTLPLLMQGLQTWTALEDKQRAEAIAAEDRRQAMVDPNDPGLQDLWDAVLGHRLMLTEDPDPTIGGRTEGAIQNAAQGSKVLGLGLPNQPAQILPRTPLGQAATAMTVPDPALGPSPFMGGMSPSALMPQSLSAPVPVAATPPPPAPVRPVARRPAFDPSKRTQGTIKLMAQLAQPAAQVRVVNDAATGKMDVERLRTQLRYVEMMGEGGDKLLALKEKTLERFSNERIKMAEIAAKVKLGQGTGDEIKDLKEFAAEAWREFNGARDEVGKMTLGLAADADPSTQAFQRVEQFKKQMNDFETEWRRRDALYAAAMAARGQKPENYKGTFEMSMSEIKALPTQDLGSMLTPEERADAQRKAEARRRAAAGASGGTP